MSATLSDEPIETRDLGSGAACPCRACAIISIMSRLIWKVGLMRQEDTRLFGFVDWLGRMMSEKVDTLIYAVFNSKSYIFCAYKYYVLLGRPSEASGCCAVLPTASPLQAHVTTDPFLSCMGLCLHMHETFLKD